MTKEYIEEKKVSHQSPYPYIISSKFYDVFIDDKNHFHMAIEDKESLMARFDFYKKFRDDLNDSKLSREEKKRSEFVTYMKVIGLPMMVMTRKDDKGEAVLLSQDEILSSISFEDNLSNFDDDKYISSDVLLSDEVSTHQAVNYLISKGLYFPDLFRLRDKVDNDSSDYQRVKIDIKRLPLNYIQDEETADKLIIDFVSDTHLLTKDTYLKFFKPLDDLTLEEKFNYAFQPIGDNKKEEIIAIKALRTYFYSIIKGLLNQFYHTFYDTDKFLFGTTVLEHGDEELDSDYSQIYFGTHFLAYGKKERFFYKKDGQMREDIIFQSYYFDKADKQSIKFAYEAVHCFMTRHHQYKFIPAVFLKMMGMPYIIFKDFEYFDFQQASSDDFVNLLNFKSNISQVSAGICKPLVYPTGQIDIEKHLTSSLRLGNYYLTHLEDKGLFISNPFAMFQSNDWVTIISAKENAITDKKIHSLITGDYNFYKEALVNFQDYDRPEEFENISNDRLQAIINNETIGAQIKIIKKIFDLMTDGLTLQEAYSSSSHDFSFEELYLIIQAGFLHIIQAKSKTLKNNYFKYDAKRVLDYFNQECIIYNPYLEYPYIHKGLYFCGYSKTPESEIYLDKRDVDRINTLIRINKQYSTNYFSFYGYRKGINIEAKIKSLNLSLGLPEEMLNVSIDKGKKLSYPFIKENISMFDKDEYLEIIKQDVQLSRIKMILMGLDDKVLLNALDSTNPLKALTPELSGKMKRFFTADNLITSILNVHLLYFEYFPLDMEHNSNSYFNYWILDKKIPGIGPDEEKQLKKCRMFFNEILFYYYHSKLGLDAWFYLFSRLKNEQEIYLSPFMTAILDPKENKLLVSEEDYQLIPKAIEASKFLVKHFNNTKLYPYLIPGMTGLPILNKDLWIKKSKSNNRFDKDLLNEYKITPIKNDYTRAPICISKIKSVKYSAYYFTFSTLFYNELLKEGYFILPRSEYRDSFESNNISVNINLLNNHRLLDGHAAYVFKDCTGVVADVFKPELTYYKELINQFLLENDLVSNYSELSFFMKEAFEYCYMHNKYFLIEARNQLSLSIDHMFIYALKEMVDFKIATDTVVNETNFKLFFAYFLYYLDHNVVINICDKLKKKI